jgi:phosphatidate cytidylyltransferase
MILIQLSIVIIVLSSLGALLIALDHERHELTRMQRKANWKKYIVYLLILFALIAVIITGKYALTFLFVLISLGGALEYFRNEKGRLLSRLIKSMSLLLLVLILLGHLLLIDSSNWYRYAILTLLIVGITDSYAQLWGKLIGKHRLCKKLSPGKTIEGMLGGIATSLLLAPILSFLAPGMDEIKLLAFTFIISVSAFAGDLVFSYIKRNLMIKDFSNLIPGHGGILDRFDSLVAAAPVSYWIIFYFSK